MATTVVEPVVVARPRPRTLGRRLRTLAIFALVIAAVAYLGVGAYIADRVTRPVRQTLHGTPADQGLSYENVNFSSVGDNIPLKGWLIDAPGTDRTIITMHGKDGTRADSSIGLPQIAQALVQHHYDVLTFDFRAHGESGGEHYSLGQWETRDVAGAVQFLKSRGRTTIGAIGWSMGAATLLNSYPDEPDIQAAVADSAFASLPELLTVQLSRNTGLPDAFNPGILLMGQFIYGLDINDNQPQRAVARLGSRPLFLIASTGDQLIPYTHTLQLQQAGAANPNLQVWIVQNPTVAHVRSYQTYSNEYIQRVTTFFDKNLH